MPTKQFRVWHITLLMGVICFMETALLGTAIDLQFMQPYQSFMSCQYESLHADSIK